MHVIHVDNVYPVAVVYGRSDTSVARNALFCMKLYTVVGHLYSTTIDDLQFRVLAILYFQQRLQKVKSIAVRNNNIVTFFDTVAFVQCHVRVTFPVIVDLIGYHVHNTELSSHSLYRA